MEMKTYSADSSSYRYGFNGMEKDDDIKGSGNSLDFGARIYDSRLGRWLALDPLMRKYPSSSPYNGLGNNPTYFVDRDGRDIIPKGDFEKTRYYKVWETLLSQKNNEFILYYNYFSTSERHLLLEQKPIKGDYATSEAYAEKTNPQSVGSSPSKPSYSIVFNDDLLTGKKSDPNNLNRFSEKYGVGTKKTTGDVYVENLRAGSNPEYINAYYTYEIADIKLAINIYHEISHNYLSVINTSYNEQHTVMLTEQYITKMKSFISDYARQNNFALIESQIEALAFSTFRYTGNQGFKDYILKRAGIPADYETNTEYTEEQRKKYQAVYKTTLEEYDKEVFELSTVKKIYSGGKNNVELSPKVE